jgi:hypothetical protein
MTKDEAHKEALKRWRELPIASRQTVGQALDFAKTLDAILEFDTLGSKPRIIEAWLIRELPQGAIAPVGTASKPVARTAPVPTPVKR